jgi:hypothetical protein
MIKKIVLGTLLTGLIALLVAGGINRTVAKTEAGVEHRGQAERTEETGAGKNGGSRGSSLGAESGDADCSGSSSGGGGRAEVDAWLELAATAVEVGDHEVLVELKTGETLSITGRPWRFALENSFAAAPGDQLTLTGFYEAEEFEVGTIANESSGQSIRIREESGRPMWAGGGRQGS